MFSDEEVSMLATDEYFVSDNNLEFNNSLVNSLVTICNEEEGTEYKVVTIGMGDEVTGIRLENSCCLPVATNARKIVKVT